MLSRSHAVHYLKINYQICLNPRHALVLNYQPKEDGKLKISDAIECGNYYEHAVNLIQ